MIILAKPFGFAGDMQLSAAKSNSGKSLTELSFAQSTAELKRMPKAEILEGKFKQQKKIVEFNLNISTEGSFQIAQDLIKNNFQLIWKTVKPEVSEICIDGKTIVVSSISNSSSQLVKKKLSIEELGASSQSILIMLKLLKLNPKDLQESFKVFKLGSDEFLLKPLAEIPSLFESVTIKFNRNGFVEKTQILEKSKDESQIEFFEFKTKKLSAQNRVPAC